MDTKTSVVPEAGHQMEGYKTKILLTRITDIQYVIDDMLDFYEKYDKDHRGLGPVTNQLWITDGLKRMRKKASDIGVLIDPGSEFRKHFHKEMDKGGVVIGELYPVFSSQEWYTIPARGWRHFDDVVFEIGGHGMVVHTRTMEEHAWGVPNATMGGEIKHNELLRLCKGEKERRPLIIDVKPIVHEWNTNEGGKFMNPNLLSAKLTGDAAYRPVRLIVRGINPRLLVENPFDQLDKEMFADPMSRLEKQIDESENRMVAHVREDQPNKEDQ